LPQALPEASSGASPSHRLVPGVLESVELRVHGVDEVIGKAMLVKRASQETEIFNQLSFLLGVFAVVIVI
jgi:hypothetical protein